MPVPTVPRPGWRPWTLALTLAGTLAAVGWAALSFGTPTLSLADLWEVVRGGGEDGMARLVLFKLRLPRLILGILAGAALGATGVILQDALRNPLAGPELTGVSAGASAVVAVLVVFHLPVSWWLFPWLACAGGLAGGLVVLAVVRRFHNPVRMALAGAAVSALFRAVVVAVAAAGAPNSVGILFLFLMGSLGNRTWQHVKVLLPWVGAGVPLALAAARVLNVLRLGDEVAEGVGLAVQRWRWMLLLLGLTMTAGVVAVCGPIGWLSLLAPHLVRYLLDTEDARQVLPLTAILGAVMLVAADFLARTLFHPQETPVGIWTAVLAMPILLVLWRWQFRNPGPQGP